MCFYLWVCLVVAMIPIWAQNPPSVIIIGAGVSGIAAGRKLYEAGYNVTMLEAEHRIGGRVHSVKFGDAYVDLGAEWCHGEKGNIVYEMVKDYGLLRHSKYKYRVFFSDRHYISEEFNQELDNLFESTYTADGHRKAEHGESIGEYWMKRFNTSIRATFGSQTFKFYKGVTCLEPFQRYVLSDIGAYSWLEAPAATTYTNCEGDQELNWNGKGYKTILEVLLKRFPKVDFNFHLEDRIQLGKEVVEVIYKEDFALALCKDGSGYVADHIIFTPSLGVLKHQHTTLFNPPLTPRKTQIIKDLGFDGVIKLMVHFPYRWWPKNGLDAWTLAWSFVDRQMLPALFPYGPIRYDLHWLRDIMTIFRLEKNPQALSIWFTGRYVPDIESMDEKLLIKGLMFMLNKFFGDRYVIPTPDGILRGTWTSNPHFRGVYSYQTMASNKDNETNPNDVLAEPVLNKRGVPRLQFAGEATHPIYYGTVHGAIETGYREAERLIKSYKN